MRNLKSKVEFQKQELIEYQEIINTSPNKNINVFAIVDGVKIQAVPVICTSKDNVLYEMLPQSKFLLNKENSTFSEINDYYGNLFSEYILTKNHFENMDYFSYIKYKRFKNSN